MPDTLQIFFKEISPSDATESDIRKHANKLERVCQEIISCRVTVGLAGKHKRQGNHYKVRVDISVPGDELVADSHPTNEDAHICVRDAFEAATRQLEEYVQRRRREVKTHSAP